MVLTDPHLVVAEPLGDDDLLELSGP